MTFVFLRHVAEAHEMASNSGVATLRNFCWPQARKNACWGAPKPSGTSGHDEAADKVPNSDVLGLDLLDRVPDHSPVSQLRWRKPSFGKSFRRLFEEIVRQCVPNGPVTGRLVGTDLCEGQCLPCLGGADGAPGEPRELLRPSGHLRGGGAGGTGPVDRKTPFQTNQTAQKG